VAIKIFYFIAAMSDDYLEVVKEQLSTIKESGLYEECSQIYVCLAGGKPRKLKAVLPPKARIAYHSRVDQFELPALHMVKEYTEAGDQILYLHTKGVSRSGSRRVAGDHWRRYMDWGCVERYREHLEALKAHDISGVQLTNLNSRFTRLCGSQKVYAGNYWWANGDYIQKLTAPEIGQNRWLAEGWIFGAEPKANDLHNLTNGGLITDKNTFSLPSFSRKTYDPYYVPPFKMPDMLQSRIQVLNLLIDKFNYKTYLEIGYFKGDCFNNIKCESKESVDPAAKGATHKMTSDKFFDQNQKLFDLIFIDGLHTAEQVTNDVYNSLACLKENGTIVCHDATPQTEQEGQYLTDFKGGVIWNGDCYKAFAKLRQTRTDLLMATLDLDFGLFVIRKSRTPQPTQPYQEIDFKAYLRNRKQLLGMIEPEEAKNWLEGLQ
jgi:hypothetical protein